MKGRVTRWHNIYTPPECAEGVFVVLGGLRSALLRLCACARPNAYSGDRQRSTAVAATDSSPPIPATRHFLTFV